MDIQMKNLVRGKGLCEQIVDKMVSKLEGQENTILLIGTAGNNDKATSQLQDMVHFLRTSECLATLAKVKQRYYHLQSILFVLINDVLYQKNYNGVLLRCIDSNQVANILHEFQDGHLRGNFSPRKTTYKIL